MDYLYFGQENQYNKMGKVIKLTESDLIRIVQRVLEEQSVVGAPNSGMTNKPQATSKPKPIQSLSCVPLAFQLAVDKLIKEGYNKQFLKVSLGIIGRESDFGESNRYKFLSPLKTLWSTLGGNASVGPGQIKPETAKEFGMTIDELTTSIGSLKTVYQILEKNYKKAIEVGYTNEPSSNFTKGTGDAALDLSIAAYNLGISKITKYCKTSNPNINKPCNLAGKTITEQVIPTYGLHKMHQELERQKKTFTVTNKELKNYIPNFKTTRLDGVSISSHGYVKEVAEKIKKYTCF
jgi:hypothetical protein